MTAYIREVNLNSGASRNAPTEPIDAALLADLSSPIEGGPDRVLMRGELGRDVPRLAGLSFIASTMGRCLGGQVWRGQALVASIGIATRSRCGARLWESMHDAPRQMHTKRGQPPATPWVAIHFAERLAPEAETAVWDYVHRIACAFLAAPAAATDEGAP